MSSLLMRYKTDTDLCKSDNFLQKFFKSILLNCKILQPPSPAFVKFLSSLSKSVKIFVQSVQFVQVCQKPFVYSVQGFVYSVNCLFWLFQTINRLIHSYKYVKIIVHNSKKSLTSIYQAFSIICQALSTLSIVFPGVIFNLFQTRFVYVDSFCLCSVLYQAYKSLIIEHLQNINKILIKIFLQLFQQLKYTLFYFCSLKIQLSLKKFLHIYFFYALILLSILL